MEYWSKLIVELSTIELDSNLADEGPNVKFFKESVRAKKYSPHADPTYESFIRGLAHKVLAELVFLPKEQKNEAITLLEKHKKHIDDASSVWAKYRDMGPNSWGADKLIEELLNYFSINTNHVIWIFEADWSHDKTPLLEDLQNGFYRKYQTADWLIQQLREHATHNDKKEKSKRVNLVAQDKHNRVVTKYEKYIKEGYTPITAIQPLVHDFRHEYGKGTLEHTKKAIQTIIRKHIGRNNKE